MVELAWRQSPFQCGRSASMHHTVWVAGKLRIERLKLTEAQLRNTSSSCRGLNLGSLYANTTRHCFFPRLGQERWLRTSFPCPCQFDLTILAMHAEPRNASWLRRPPNSSTQSPNLLPIAPNTRLLFCFDTNLLTSSLHVLLLCSSLSMLSLAIPNLSVLS